MLLMEKVYDSATGITFTEKPTEYDQTVKANEMNPILSVYNSLLNLGITSSTDSKDKKYIRITNFIAFNSFIGSLLYLTLAIIWDNVYYFESMFLITAVSMATMVFNAYSKINTARVLYVVGTNVAVFLNVLVTGPLTHADSFLILAIVIPFLIFDIRRIWVVGLSVLLPLSLLLVYSSLIPLFTSYNLDEDKQMLLRTINICVEIVLLLTAIYQFLYYNRKTEDDLELSNAQMLMQTSELRRSNSDLEQFAYIISHDLKTPVRNISSFMNLLANKYGPSMSGEAREFVDYSFQGAKRLERLIDDVLAYCRIGTNLSKPIPVNLNDVANTIRFELRDKLSATNSTVLINKELPVISNVHASLMYHIFQNLINNGLKFNKSESPEININWTNSLNYYTFAIQDNGIGVSKEYSNTIFQMFKRLHNEHEYDGTGIGLAICKKIVEYYHGEIWFESEEGKGTTFYFTIRKF
jgi:signal transduction histidine kinase